MQGHGHLSSPSLADPTAFPFQEIPTPTFSVVQVRTPTVIFGTSLFYYSSHPVHQRLLTHPHAQGIWNLSTTHCFHCSTLVHTSITFCLVTVVISYLASSFPALLPGASQHSSQNDHSEMYIWRIMPLLQTHQWLSISHRMKWLTKGYKSLHNMALLLILWPHCLSLSPLFPVHGDLLAAPVCVW